MMRIAMLLMPVVLLGACGGAKTDERDTAAGKILPGSASDAMLQTDRLQAEAPLAAPELVDEDGDAAPKGANAGRDAEKAKADDTPDATEPAAPAATPTAAAPPAPSPTE